MNRGRCLKEGEGGSAIRTSSRRFTNAEPLLGQAVVVPQEFRIEQTLQIVELLILMQIRGDRWKVDLPPRLGPDVV